MDRFLSIWKCQLVLGKYFWMFGFWCRHKKIWFRSETHSRGDVYSAVFDVSISQKYWRSFLRKVNKASLEMGSPMQMMLRTQTGLFYLGKGREKLPHTLCQLAQLDSGPFSLLNKIGLYLSGVFLSEDKPWWEDLKVSLSAKPDQGHAKLLIFCFL